MTQYTAPLRDMNFVLDELAGLADVAKLPGFEEAGPETVEAILDEAAKFASQVLAPINAEGDAVGCTWKDGEVTTPPGFKQAYGQFVAWGWNGLNCPHHFGGQGLPKLVASPVSEIVMSANLGLSLCPVLTSGAVRGGWQMFGASSISQRNRRISRRACGGTLGAPSRSRGADAHLPAEAFADTHSQRTVKTAAVAVSAWGRTPALYRVAGGLPSIGRVAAHIPGHQRPCIASLSARRETPPRHRSRALSAPAVGYPYRATDR